MRDNVLIFHAGETFPVDDLYRPYRYATLAEELVSGGVSVDRYALSINHFTKDMRFNQTEEVRFEDFYRVIFLHGGGYQENISLARMRVYVVSAGKLIFWLFGGRSKRSKGAIISFPSVEMAWVASIYCKVRGIPYILDVRDLWPDIFYNRGSRVRRMLIKGLMLPYRLMVSFIAKNAVAVTAVSQSYLEWGLRCAGRVKSESDVVFPLGFASVKPNNFWDAELSEEFRARAASEGAINCVYVGQFEDSYDLDTVITAAKLISDVDLNINFILCGKGVGLQKVRESSNLLNNVQVTGFISSSSIASVMSNCHVGLVAYREKALQGLPNKPFEYMSGGLALVSSLRGELDDVIENNGLGLRYDSGDPKSLAARLRYLRDEPDHLRLMMGHSREIFGSEYQASNVYRKMANYCLRCFKTEAEN